MDRNSFSCFCLNSQWLFGFFVAVVFCLMSPICSATSRVEVECENELRDLFSRELGHTLIGAKPVSFREWFWCHSTSSQLKDMTIDFLKRTFANSKTFILLMHSSSSCLGITLIHRPLLIKTIQNEKYLQNFIKRHFGSAENFLGILPEYKKSIFELVAFDDRALGLLFGYGRTNTMYASRRMEIQDFLEKSCGYRLWPIPHVEIITFAPFCVISHSCIDLVLPNNKPSPGFHSLEEELQYLNSIEYEIPKFPPPYLCTPPFFIAKQCPETDRLIKHYKKSVDKLAQIYLQTPISQFLTKQSAC